MLVTFCLLIEMDMKFSCNENYLNYFFPNLKDFKGKWVYLDIWIWAEYSYYQKLYFIFVKVSSSKGWLSSIL